MPSPFIEQIRADMRLRGYGLRTEKSYLGWIRQYIYFHKKQHPKKLGSNYAGTSSPLDNLPFPSSS